VNGLYLRVILFERGLTQKTGNIFLEIFMFLR